MRRADKALLVMQIRCLQFTTPFTNSLAFLVSSVSLLAYLFWVFLRWLIFFFDQYPSIQLFEVLRLTEWRVKHRNPSFCVLELACVTYTRWSLHSARFQFFLFRKATRDLRLLHLENLSLTIAFDCQPGHQWIIFLTSRYRCGKKRAEERLEFFLSLYLVFASFRRWLSNSRKCFRTRKTSVRRIPFRLTVPRHHHPCIFNLNPVVDKMLLVY